MQNVSNLQIPEGVVRTIHDKNNRLIWGRLAYDTKYAGNTLQNGTPTPDTPIPVQTVTGRQVVTVSDSGSQSQEYEVNLGKNLFNKDNYSSLPGYFDSDRAITNGVTNRNIVFYLPCKPNTVYSLQRMSSSGSNCLVGTTAQLPAYGVTVDNIMTWSAMTNGYTTGSTAQYLCLRYQTATSTTSISSVLNDLISSIQIEQNSTVTSYASYFTPIELCKIGDYQDYIYKGDDGWYIHKEVWKYVFSGSDDWYFSGNSIKCNFGNSRPDISSGYNFTNYQTIGLYSNQGQEYPARNIYLDGGSGVVGLGAVNTGGGNTSVYVPKGAWTVDSWKTHLSNMPLVVYAILATFTDTKITNADLVGQLETIHKWLTRYGYNATVSGNLPLIVDRTNL